MEKQRLIEFAEALRNKLNYFDELENVRFGFWHKNFNMNVVLLFSFSDHLVNSFSFILVLMDHFDRKWHLLVIKNYKVKNINEISIYIFPKEFLLLFSTMREKNLLQKFLSNVW